MSSLYEKALDKILSRINATPPIHQEDFHAIVELFDRMLRAGKRVHSADAIEDYLTEKKGMDAEMAHDIQMIYEVLESLHFESRPSRWNEEFIKDLLV